MTDTTIRIAGYPHAAVRQPIPCFEDMLMTWDGDVVEITLTTGEKVAGQLQMSHDGTAAWIIGEWAVASSGNGEPKLWDHSRERGIRTNHIIAVEHIEERS
jgi:hypothetical protein